MDCCQIQYNPILPWASRFPRASGICRNHLQLQLEFLMTLILMWILAPKSRWVFWSWSILWSSTYPNASAKPQTVTIMEGIPWNEKMTCQHWSSTSDANRYILQHVQCNSVDTNGIQWSEQKQQYRTIPYNTLILLIFQLSSILISTTITTIHAGFLKLRVTRLSIGIAMKGSNQETSSWRCMTWIRDDHAGL